MPKELKLTFVKGNARVDKTITLNACVVAGWTGRNQAALQEHIKELAELGVRPPSKTPIFYLVAVDRVTTAASIEALGDQSSGEVEFVLLQSGGELWLGVGSDHTDRHVESYSVAVSKQLCEKPIGTTFWPYAEVKDHWERLRLTSHIEEGGSRKLYQECLVTMMLPPETLMTQYCGSAVMPEGTLMFCGTSAAHGGIRPSASFQCTLDDPQLGRSLSHQYAIKTLDVVS